MKKLLAVLLVVAMLVPMSLAVPTKAEEVQKKPFYTLNWSGVDQEYNNNMISFLTASFTGRGEDIIFTGAGASLNDNSYTDTDVAAMAAAIKTRMDKRPAGQRYVYISGNGDMFGLAPENSLFMDYYVGRMAKMMEDLFKKMKDIGCPLDGVLIDTEYVGLSCYYLIDTANSYQPNSLPENPDLLRDIVKDKRYKTEIRPLLEEYGFVFYDAGDPAKQKTFTELFSLTKGAGAKYSKSRSIWDTVMRIHLNRYNDQWLYEPLKKYYPDAHCSDYQSMDTNSWLKMAGVADDGTVMNGGNSHRVGNTSTTSFYYTSPSPSDLKNMIKIAGLNAPYFAAEPFTGLLYDINFFRYMYNSSETKQVAPWIAGYTYVYTGDKRVRTGNSPYYTDLLYHLGMFAPEPFLGYLWTGDLDNFEGEYKLNCKIISDIMQALSDVAGYADRKHIEMPINWNSKFLLTGMYTGGRNLWRITPNNNVVSRSNFLVSKEGEDPTFYANGETVTFPGGKILEEATIKDTNDTEIGSVGYWVETAKDVVPVITSEEGRYENYPALEYDFENYKIGTFDYITSTTEESAVNNWNLKWSATKAGVKGASNIVSIDGNKMLSAIGNTQMGIKALPAKITAGDTFAEDQGWQITVTIPENLSKDAQITLLNYAGSGQEITDGGFMVKDGKLYYASDANDDAGQPIYQELMDVDTDTPYTLKRLLDFNNKDAFTCTYVVQDKNGRTLKTVENVPVPTFDIIETIGFSVTEADKAVAFDDFKIYVTGVATDFFVYDAKTGQDAELGVQRDSATAYRLSWLNATEKQETAYIKADITEGGKTTTTVIKEVTLLPGTDSVATGVVDVKEGQTVKVYMESTLKPVAAEDEIGPLVDTEFVEGGLEKVPSALKNSSLDTLEKMKEALEAKLKATNSEVANFNHYALKIDKTEIPRNGKMTVIMPYPAGSDANCTFYVAQLHTADAYGKTAGEITAAEAANTSAGIQFTVFGTSPITVAWVVPQVIEETEAPTRAPDVLARPTGTRITRPTEAPEIEETEEPTEETEYIEPTEEPTVAPTEATDAPTETTAPAVVEEGGVNLVLIIVIAVVVLAAAGAAVFFLLKKKKAAPVVDALEEIEEAPEAEENTEE